MFQLCHWHAVPFLIEELKQFNGQVPKHFHLKFLLKTLKSWMKSPPENVNVSELFHMLSRAVKQQSHIEMEQPIKLTIPVSTITKSIDTCYSHAADLTDRDSVRQLMTSRHAQVQQQTKDLDDKLGSA